MHYFISNYVVRLQLRNWPPFCTDTDTIQILYVCRLKNVYTKTYVNVINRTLLYSMYYHQLFPPPVVRAWNTKVRQGMVKRALTQNRYIDFLLYLPSFSRCFVHSAEIK